VGGSARRRGRKKVSFREEWKVRKEADLAQSSDTSEASGETMGEKRRARAIEGKKTTVRKGGESSSDNTKLQDVRSTDAQCRRKRKGLSLTSAS